MHPIVDGRPDYRRVVVCMCRKEQVELDRMAAMVKLCNLPEATAGWTFDSFEVNDQLREVYDAALQLAEEQGIKWLTLMGDWDRGKSHLLVAVCRRWLARGKAARYAYVPLLLKELQAGFGKEGEYERLFGFFCNVPLLALDDLGVEKRSDWAMQELDTIVDYRYVHALPLMVTTNLALDELPPRIASRLQRFQPGKVLSINAPEYRLRR